jgi:hypothetical protein
VEPIDLEAHADTLDRAVLAAPDIDRFCSSSSWILPAAAALGPPGAAPFSFSGPDGFLAAALRRHGAARTVEALEASWGLACPLIAPDPVRLVDAVADLLRAREAAWDFLLLSGLPLGSSLLSAAHACLGRRYRLGLGPTTRRHVASLRGGLDGWLSRRSRAVRKTLRQGARRAADDGIALAPERADDDAAADRLFGRALEVERRSWKGRDGVGLDTDEMRRFYRLMIRRLARHGSLRCVVARRGELDVAYVLAASFGSTLRGLQFGFDDRFRRAGLGNLAQQHLVALAAGEPQLTEYDLGTGGDYKPAWAETVRDSVLLVASRT